MSADHCHPTASSKAGSQPGSQIPGSLPGSVLWAMEGDQTPAGDHRLLGLSSWGDGEGTVGGTVSPLVRSFSEGLVLVFSPQTCVSYCKQRNNVCAQAGFLSRTQRGFFRVTETGPAPGKQPATWQGP